MRGLFHDLVSNRWRLFCQALQARQLKTCLLLGLSLPLNTLRDAAGLPLVSFVFYAIKKAEETPEKSRFLSVFVPSMTLLLIVGYIVGVATVFALLGLSVPWASAAVVPFAVLLVYCAHIEFHLRNLMVPLQTLTAPSKL